MDNPMWKCDRCGADKSDLLGHAHDFVIDCPQCRPGPQGVPGCYPLDDPDERASDFTYSRESDVEPDANSMQKSMNEIDLGAPFIKVMRPDDPRMEQIQQ